MATEAAQHHRCTSPHLEGNRTMLRPSHVPQSPVSGLRSGSCSLRWVSPWPPAKGHVCSDSRQQCASSMPASYSGASNHVVGRTLYAPVNGRQVLQRAITRRKLHRLSYSTVGFGSQRQCAEGMKRHGQAQHPMASRVLLRTMLAVVAASSRAFTEASAARAGQLSSVVTMDARQRDQGPGMSASALEAVVIGTQKAGAGTRALKVRQPRPQNRPSDLEFPKSTGTS